MMESGEAVSAAEKVRPTLETAKSSGDALLCRATSDHSPTAPDHRELERGEKGADTHLHGISWLSLTQVLDTQ